MRPRLAAPAAPAQEPNVRVSTKPANRPMRSGAADARDRDLRRPSASSICSRVAPDHDGAARARDTDAPTQGQAGNASSRRSSASADRLAGASRKVFVPKLDGAYLRAEQAHALDVRPRLRMSSEPM